MTVVNRNKGFAPVIDEQSKVLILGSFPSVKSRAVGFYYGNPQNRFWKTLETVFNERIPNDTDGKIHFLFKRNIALWDVYESSSIKGSADADLNNNTSITAPLKQLVLSYPKLQVAICNGKKAYEVAKKELDNNLPCIYLSSTSSANPGYNEKEWVRSLREYLFIKDRNIL